MRIGSLPATTMKCQAKVEDAGDATSASPYSKHDDDVRDIHKPVWSFRIYLVIVLFSLSATLGLESLWVTLPVTSDHLPEGQRITTFLVIFTVVGNVGTLAYLLTRRCSSPSVSHQVVPIYSCLLASLVSAGLLALFWDSPETLRHQEYHIVYLTAALCMAAVACVGTATYVPFVESMKAEYITAVIMGEGLAGLIPHLVAIGQGIGEPPACRPDRPINLTWSISVYRSRLRPTTTLAPIIPPPLRFNESIFFFVVTGVMCVAGFCFLLLRCIPSVRVHYEAPDGMGATEQLRRPLRIRGIEDDNEELLNTHHNHPHNIDTINSSSTVPHPLILDDGSIRHGTPGSATRNQEEPYNSFRNRYVDSDPTPLVPPAPPAPHAHHPYSRVFPMVGDGEHEATIINSGRIVHPRCSRNTNPMKRTLTPFRPPNICLMLTFTFWACLVVSGPLSSTKAHTCLPLGNRAFQSGTLMTKLAAIIAVIVTMRVNPYSRVTMVVAFTSLGTIVLTYFVALISFSHESQSKEDSPIFMNTGELLSTIAWASVTGLFFFTKSMVAILLRQHRRDMLVWYAAVSQLGATLGALFMLNDISICRIYRDFEKLYCKSKS